MDGELYYDESYYDAYDDYDYDNDGEFFDDDARFVLTPWGIMVCICKDYNVDLSHLTPKMGEHMMEDFFAAMERAGHLQKVVDNESKDREE